MYGKIFEEIFDSSLSSQGDFVTTYVFMSMIVLADENGFVNYSKEALFERLKFPHDFTCGESFREAIKTLEAEDSESNLPYENGRRIIPLSEMGAIEGNRGWLIVNYLHYRDKANNDEKKKSRSEYMKKYMQERRKKGNENKGVNSCKQSVNSCKQNSSYTDTDTDTDIKKKINKEKVTRFKKPTIDEIRAYCEERKNTINAEQFFDSYETVGWIVGSTKKPMKNWKSAIHTWERNEVKYGKDSGIRETNTRRKSGAEILAEGCAGAFE